MSNVLNLKPEDIDTPEKRSKYTLTIVGCSQNGVLLSCSFADAGFKVTCSDVDPTVTKKLSRGKTCFIDAEVEGKLKYQISKGQLVITNDLKKATAKSDIVVVTLKPKVDEKKKVNTSELVGACRLVGAALPEGALVIYSGVSGLGFVDGALREAIEDTSGFKAGLGFGLAYVPFLDYGTHTTKSIADLGLKVAGVGERSLKAAVVILSTIAKTVKPLSNVRIAEVAKLFSLARRDADTALANELTVFCESAGVDYFEALKALEIDDFKPSVTEEKAKDDSYLLLESAENINAKLRLPTLARQVNEEMVKHAVSLAQDALRDRGKTLRRAKVALLGPACRGTGELVKLLESKGANVTVFDQDARKDTLELGAVKTNLNEATEGADCVMVLAWTEQLKNINLKKLKALTKTPQVLVDLAGVFEPKEVEAEGFAYLGLGRGARQK